MGGVPPGPLPLLLTLNQPDGGRCGQWYVVQVQGTGRNHAGWPRRSTVAGAKKHKYNTYKIQYKYV
jgi:hypothetical protein